MHFLLPLSTSLSSVFFFFHAPTPPEIYTLSLHDALPILHGWVQRLPAGSLRGPGALGAPLPGGAGGAEEAAAGGDRKSTRLNSSHVAISYAVFCLKKKKRE